MRVRLANDQPVVLTHYVYVEINVEGVVAGIKAYVLPVEMGYELLLGLNYMSRVRMIVGYNDHNITMRGNDGVVRQV